MKAKFNPIKNIICGALLLAMMAFMCCDGVKGWLGQSQALQYAFNAFSILAGIPLCLWSSDLYRWAMGDQLESDGQDD
ncbi:MAG: hypothetical protein IJK73_01185 [Bacteroidales bacterium]|nr:hypothetical protein [Bacteroidales bacterium]